MAYEDETDAPRARPRHVAVIPDGSRRWARERGYPVADGYQAGVRTGLDVLAWCLEAGIPHVSAFGSSRDNLANRSPEEVLAIHAAVRRLCAESADIPGVAVHVFGAPERLPRTVPERDELVQLAHLDPPTGRLVLHVAVAYGPYDEALALAAAGERVGRDAVARDPQRFLLSAGVPAADLVLRTGARLCLSGFLPLQTANAELHFVPTLWPALTRAEFDGVLTRFVAPDERPGA
jgi:short-chain Z-isoprenyl diphosphate synthase